MVRLLFFVISSLCLLQSSVGVVDNQSNGDDNKHSIRFRRSRSVIPPNAERTRAVTLPPIPAPIATPVQGPSVSYSLFKWFMKFFIYKTFTLYSSDSWSFSLTKLTQNRCQRQNRVMTAITPVKDVTGRIVKLFADQMNQGASLLIFTIVQQLQRNARRVAAENISTRALSTPLFPNKLSQQHALSIVTSSRSTSRKF